MSEDATPYWLIATPITSGYSPQDDWNSARTARARACVPSHAPSG